MGEATSCEVNGFVGWLASFAAFFAYCCWALCSTEQLNQLGVTYYPDRYWALALPVMLLVALAIVFFGYAFINILYAPPPDNIKQFTDKRARPPCAAAERALQLMAAASAAAMVESTAAAAAAKECPQRLTCQQGMQEPILKSLEEQRPQQGYPRSCSVGDFPLSLVSRALFPINPNLEGRPCTIQGPPFFYQPLRVPPSA